MSDLFSAIRPFNNSLSPQVLIYPYNLTPVHRAMAKDTFIKQQIYTISSSKKKNMSTNPPQSTITRHQISSACHKLFNFLPHAWQSDAIWTLCDAHKNKKATNMLLIRPTGAGKSLVYQVTSVLIRGVTLFISPLLALSSE